MRALHPHMHPASSQAVHRVNQVEQAKQANRVKQADQANQASQASQAASQNLAAVAVATTIQHPAGTSTLNKHLAGGKQESNQDPQREYY